MPRGGQVRSNCYFLLDCHSFFVLPSFREKSNKRRHSPVLCGCLPTSVQDVTSPYRHCVALSVRPHHQRESSDSHAPWGTQIDGSSLNSVRSTINVFVFTASTAVQLDLVDVRQFCFSSNCIP